MFPNLPSRYVPDGSQANGGFGSVFFCDDTHLERKVAIKVVNGELNRRRISDEMQALLQMRSKHVVQVYDVVVSADGRLGIVQEYVEGRDLSELNLTSASVSDYLKIIWQVSSGIADIHSANVIHRDIKPNNIKVDAEGVIKIFDFGLAREEGPFAKTIGFVGTVGFAAPELLQGGQFTRAVDVYAFAVTALFLAAGDLPPCLLTMPSSKPVPNPFLSTAFTLPSAVSDILYKCLASAPQDRPEMDEVESVLKRHLLFNRHQALAVHKGQATYINSSEPFVSLDALPIGRVDIQYDGLQFKIVDMEGEVSINNRTPDLFQEIPGSCVISLGGGHRRAAERMFITFDVSYPEVVV
jgi:serine/threonine-protein kinase